MSEEIKDIEVVETIDKEQDDKRAPAIVGFIFSILAFENIGSLVGLIFAVIGLISAKKAKGVKTTLHQVFRGIAKPVSLICLILNILLIIETIVIISLLISAAIIAGVIIAILGANGYL